MGRQTALPPTCAEVWENERPLYSLAFPARSPNLFPVPRVF